MNQTLDLRSTYTLWNMNTQPIVPQRLYYTYIFILYIPKFAPFLERMLANSVSGNSAQTLNPSEKEL